MLSFAYNMLHKSEWEKDLNAGCTNVHASPNHADACRSECVLYHKIDGKCEELNGLTGN